MAVHRMTQLLLPPGKYQDMRWCEDCGGPQLMISVFEIDTGRIALCLGCEQEKFLPFTRATLEAA
jgi:hypothetical protein